MLRVTVAAVGRPRGGPEQGLTTDYLGRATAAGRGLGLGPFVLAECDERKAARLVEAAGPGAFALVLDERGQAMTSPAFAALIGGLRDAGRGEVVCLIGGADGHDAATRARADAMLSLGPMVWPHLLVRAMLAEQLYRAVSILAQGPYHRG